MEFVNKELFNYDYNTNKKFYTKDGAYENESMQIKNENCIIDITDQNLDYQNLTYYPNLKCSLRKTVKYPCTICIWCTLRVCDYLGCLI